MADALGLGCSCQCSAAEDSARRAATDLQNAQTK